MNKLPFNDSTVVNVNTLLEDNEDQETKDDKKNHKSFKDKITWQFLEKRQIFLWGGVMDKSAEEIIEKLFFLEHEKAGEPIYFFINSPGGVITSGMAVYDVMHMITSPVYTVNMGMAASMGAILFAAGEKGHRYMFPHSKLMIHQPLISGQIVAPAIDIKIHADEIKKTREEINRILAETSGQDLQKITKDTDRDYWLNAQESMDYGIADAVLNDFSVFQNSSKISKATLKAKNTRTRKKST